MSLLGVFLGGEGRNELGSRVGHPSYQSDDYPGVIEALLRRIRREGWAVIGAVQWCHITKLRARGPTPKEEQNVLGLVLEAKRADAEILAFIRDADADAERCGSIDVAMNRAEEMFSELHIIGGAAYPVLEAWLLAMMDHHRTEKLSKSDAQSKLIKEGISEKDTPEIVSRLSEARIPRL